MARYDRRILLPYLRNIYCIELSIQAQKDHCVQLRSDLTQLEEDLQSVRCPEEVLPASPVAAFLLSCISVSLCFLAVLAGVLPVSSVVLQTIGSVCLLAAFVFFLLSVGKLRKYSIQKKLYLRYCRNLEEYNRQAPQREQMAQQIAAFREELGELTTQLNEAAYLRHTLFNLNVIPVQYRTLSACKYLFDYFLSSKADDIDIVLQSYALVHMQESGALPDANHPHGLLIQRTRIADQVICDPSHRESYEAQMQAIADQEPNSGLRSQYTKMIHADLCVSDYFSRYASQTVGTLSA